MAETLIAVVAAAPLLRGADTDAEDATYAAQAKELIRSLITKCPGSGPIRGVWEFNGVVYAFRDTEAGDACQMWHTTEHGWEVNDIGVTLLPGGRYEFITENFYGASASVMMYGVDGVNKGFQFDGTTFTQITTGMAVDAPTHLYAHKYHLFYSFAGGSVQHSAPGDPPTWSPVLGAAELAIGQECVGFLGAPGEVLVIFGRNKTLMLKGANVTDWVLNTHDEKAGAVEWTLQRFKVPTYLDDRGITNLNAVQAYGDFNSATMTQKLQKAIDAMVPLAIDSMTVRTKNQYRLILSDGRILILGFDGKSMIGGTILAYTTPMVITASIEDAAGNEALLGGCNNGYVYRLDSGNSFDGEVVDAYLRPVFNHLGSPEYKKRFFKAVLELDADEIMTLQFLPVFSYGATDLPAAISHDIDIIGGGGIWDAPDTFWRDFYWDSQLISTAEGYIDGTGKNISLLIQSSATYERPHTIQGVIFHYTQRGVNR